VAHLQNTIEILSHHLLRAARNDEASEISDLYEARDNEAAEEKPV
jgi:hypothetical protein